MADDNTRSDRRGVDDRDDRDRVRRGGANRDDRERDYPQDRAGKEDRGDHRDDRERGDRLDRGDRGDRGGDRDYPQDRAGRDDRGAGGRGNKEEGSYGRREGENPRRRDDFRDDRGGADRSDRGERVDRMDRGDREHRDRDRGDRDPRDRTDRGDVRDRPRGDYGDRGERQERGDSGYTESDRRHDTSPASDTGRSDNAAATDMVRPEPKVYIRNMDFGTTDDDLRRHFRICGPIEHIRRQGKGSAVITFGFLEAAEVAVKDMQGTKVSNGGRNGERPIELMVWKKRPKKKRPKFTGIKGQGYFSEAGKEEKEAQDSVFLRGLPPGTTKDEVKAHCSAAGIVQEVKLHGDARKRASNGDAVVTYGSVEEAAKAIELLHDQQFMSKSAVIQVREYINYKKKKYDVWVAGFDKGTNSETLRKHCEKVGKVSAFKFFKKKQARVRYDTEEEAVKAFEELQGTQLIGNIQQLTFSMEKMDMTEPETPEDEVQWAFEGDMIVDDPTSFVPTSGQVDYIAADPAIDRRV